MSLGFDPRLGRFWRAILSETVHGGGADYQTTRRRTSRRVWES